MVTAWVSDTEARRLLRQGVSGIFLKKAPLNELKESIRVVAAGRTWMDNSFGAAAAEPDREAGGASLSDRQRQGATLCIGRPFE